MATGNEKIHELSAKVQEHEVRLNRQDSDAESEKDTRKRRNEGFDKDIKELRDWKNNLNGRIRVSETLAKLGWGLVVGLLLAILGWYLNKK